MWCLSQMNGKPQLVCDRCHRHVSVAQGLVCWLAPVDKTRPFATSVVHPQCLELIREKYPKMVSMSVYDYLTGLVDNDQPEVRRGTRHD
jgi:hypothetical protein